jgi:lysozyme family protein
VILASDIIDGILAREGLKFTDRPDDKGGPTFCGITLATLRAWRAPAATSVDDLKSLDPQTVRSIYQHMYVTAPGFGQIADQALQALVVDAGVQHSQEEAAKMVQRAVGVIVDGHLGAVSLSAINSHEATSLRMLVCGARIRLYGALVAHDPKLTLARAAGYELQADNALGWANRIAQFVEIIT